MSPDQAPLSPLFRVVQARLEGDGRPVIVGHLITRNCMCNCRSCLWKHNEYEDVPFEDIRKFYAQVCCSCNSPNMVDLSHPWENPQLIFEQGGIALGQPIKTERAEAKARPHMKRSE